MAEALTVDAMLPAYKHHEPFFCSQMSNAEDKDDFLTGRSYGCSCQSKNHGAPAKTLEHFHFCKHAFSKPNNLIAASTITLIATNNHSLT